MFRGGCVFVAGSAHLDVLARMTGDEDTVDKIGHVDIEIGGTAANIATNLAVMGLKPRLLTAMQEDSPYSGIITAHLRGQGVDVRVVHHKDMPAAVFSAHIGRDGEMVSAVSSMPVETAVFKPDVIRQNLEGAQCAILECNLSSATLNQIAKIAHKLSIPVFVACVSEEKSLRLAAITSPLAGVFMNLREFTYLGRRVYGSTAVSAVAHQLGCPVIITCDKSGVTLVEKGRKTDILPIVIKSKVHTLGAGDALLAATVAHHIFGRLGLAEGVKKAITFAAKIMSKPNCSAGQGHAIEQALISLNRMATRDPMTGLINRRAADQILCDTHEEAQHTNGGYSVLMVDIDHFKRVNDSYGHDIGDVVIKAVADVLRGVVRDADASCRWGGEEFLCILKGADSSTAAKVAERIRATVERRTVKVAGKFTVSIGVATWCAAAPDATSLVKAADDGLYEAKQSGRNQVAVAPLGHDAAPRLGTASGRSKRAKSEKNEELGLVMN